MEIFLFDLWQVNANARRECQTLPKLQRSLKICDGVRLDSQQVIGQQSDSDAFSQGCLDNLTVSVSLISTSHHFTDVSLLWLIIMDWGPFWIFEFVYIKFLYATSQKESKVFACLLLEKSVSRL